MIDEAQEPSFRQLNAGPLFFNGLIAFLMIICGLLSYLEIMDGLAAALAILIILAIGTLGNFIGLTVTIATGRSSQIIIFLLGLLATGILFYLLWMGLGSSHIGKRGG